MSLRRFGAALIAAAALTGIAAPAASAQPAANAAALNSAIVDGIKKTDCRTLGFVLNELNKRTGGKVLTESTTRTQLIKNLRGLTPEDRKNIYVNLVSAQYAHGTADRALECGLVKPDPTIPGFDSQLSAQASSQLADLALLADILK